MIFRKLQYMPTLIDIYKDQEMNSYCPVVLSKLLELQCAWKSPRHLVEMYLLGLVQCLKFCISKMPPGNANFAGQWVAL